MQQSTEQNQDNARRKTWTRRALLTLSGVALIAAGWGVGLYQGRDSASAQTVQKPHILTEKVMTVGGSIAHGELDPNNNSYLKRAFTSLSKSTNVKYVYDDHTVVGASAAEFDQNGKFQSWLTSDKPQIVVISWGFLNSIFNKASTADFAKAVHDEIAQSLAEHAIVIFVTSPVSKATATYYHTQVQNYIDIEQQQAQSFHNPNIHFIDLNNYMSLYMATHGQTWKDYYGDSWHPDGAGQKLGGQLLFDELVQHFGVKPIHWKEHKTTNGNTG